MFLFLLKAILCDSVDKTRRQSGQCYSHYTEDGCRTCVSRNETVKCGWCESMNICTEGTEEGPTLFYCSKGDWFFEPPMKCKKSSCAIATKEEECKAPCTWTKKGCMVASKLKVIKEAKQEQSEKVGHANQVFLGVGIACAVVAIIAIGVLVWKSKRPLYKELPLMNSVMKLDALPLANGANANV